MRRWCAVRTVAPPIVAEDGPLFITSAPDLLAEGPVPAVAVKQLLLDHLFGAPA